MPSDVRAEYGDERGRLDGGTEHTSDENCRDRWPFGEYFKCTECGDHVHEDDVVLEEFNLASYRTLCPDCSKEMESDQS